MPWNLFPSQNVSNAKAKLHTFNITKAYPGLEAGIEKRKGSSTTYLLDILQKFIIRREEQHLAGITNWKIVIGLLTASSYFIPGRNITSISKNTNKKCRFTIGKILLLGFSLRLSRMQSSLGELSWFLVQIHILKIILIICLCIKRDISHFPSLHI